jgi:hypothetical protein
MVANIKKLGPLALPVQYIENAKEMEHIEPETAGKEEGIYA